MTNLHKIPTIQSRPIRRMDNQRLIPKESRAGLISRNKQIGILGLKRFIGRHKDRTVFPADITHFARLRLIRVTGGFGAAVVGV